MPDITERFEIAQPPYVVWDYLQDVPAVVKEYMNAGYYVTKAGEEVKSQRRFLRTQRGAYARKYQLIVTHATTWRRRRDDH